MKAQKGMIIAEVNIRLEIGGCGNCYHPKQEIAKGGLKFGFGGWFGIKT